jgi:hypothetical protein
MIAPREDDRHAFAIVPCHERTLGASRHVPRSRR